MKRMIDAEKFLDKLLYMGYMDEQKSEVEDVANRMTEDAYTKDEVITMFSELQLEIKELWDNRYDVWLDNQYYIGKSDTLEEVDEAIQQKINVLRGANNE